MSEAKPIGGGFQPGDCADCAEDQRDLDKMLALVVAAFPPTPDCDVRAHALNCARYAAALVIERRKVLEDWAK